MHGYFYSLRFIDKLYKRWVRFIKIQPEYAQTERAIELALRSFELSGVALPKTEQEKFAAIQSELSTLSATFSDHILDATQAFVLPLADSQLKGLTESGLARNKE